MADYVNEVQQLYVAYFSRPADAAGLTYWVDQLQHNPNALQDISAAFSQSAEYKAMYGNMSNADVVNAVYLHLFGRAAEQAGLDYWTHDLDAHLMSVDNVVTTIARGAQGSDLFAYDAKVAVATTFTGHLDTTAEQQAYSGAAANKIAFDFIATVKDLGSAAAANDPGQIDSVISQIVNGGPSGLGYAHVIGLPDVPPPMHG